MKVVVTGAYGFLGRYVARQAAARRHEVVGLGHGDWPEEEWRSWGLAGWHEVDVNVASLVAHAGSPDVLVHCAGGSSVAASIEDPAEDFHRTAATTLDVVEFLRTCSPQTALVYPSSAAVYGRVASLPIAEDAPLEPISPYGVHKRIAEEVLRSYARSYGVRVAIVRLFSAYGPGLRKQLLWDACRKAVLGNGIFAGTGHETRDWIHADDAAVLLLAAAEHASSTVPIVNGATGAEVAVGDVLAVLFDALGVQTRPTFTGASRPGDPERYVGDPSRALEWGWVPQRPWADGVREYAHWFRGTRA